MSTATLFALALAALSQSTGTEPKPSPIEGPKRVCLKYSNFELLAGERLVDFGGGVETMGLTLERPGGGISIAESEIFAAPARLGRLVARYGDTRVYRSRHNGSYSYRFTGPTSFQPDAKRMVLVLSGTGFTGRKGDAAIFGRFRVADPGTVQCEQRFLYGWDLISANMEKK